MRRGAVAAPDEPRARTRRRRIPGGSDDRVQRAPGLRPDRRPVGRRPDRLHRSAPDRRVPGHVPEGLRRRRPRCRAQPACDRPRVSRAARSPGEPGDLDRAGRHLRRALRRDRATRPDVPGRRASASCPPTAAESGCRRRAPSSSRGNRRLGACTRCACDRGAGRSVQTYAKGERLVAASHAFGFFTKRPPSESLVHAVNGTLTVRGQRVVVSVKADAELGGVRAVVQVHALCSRTA